MSSKNQPMVRRKVVHSQRVQVPSERATERSVADPSQRVETQRPSGVSRASERREQERGPQHKVLRPKQRRAAAKYAVEHLGRSQRGDCRAIGLNRSTLQYKPREKNDEPLKQAIRKIVQ